jgi:transposase
VGRPAKHSVDFKLRVVLGVLRGEMSSAEAARRHGVSETSIGKWKEAFIRAGREGLAPKAAAGRGSGEEARLAGQVDELTRALGEAHVELRLLRRDGAGLLPPTQSWR